MNLLKKTENIILLKKELKQTMKKPQQMIKNHNSTTTFGGLIYESDFNTEDCNGNTVLRMLCDWRFDEQCKRNIQIRRNSEENTLYN